MSRLAFLTLATLLLAARVALKAAEAPSRPNILFIITDQQFSEAMSCRMGKHFLNTPTLDRLVQNGRLFTRAYSANPLCMPSRNSMFTGRYPHDTGVTANDPPAGGQLDPKEFPCMGTYFHQAGYQTAYFGKWHLCFNMKDPSAHGFETVDLAGQIDAQVAAMAGNFLKQKHSQPFLLVASFMNPHNVCEWSRRLAGHKQALTQGEIGEPPPLAQLPPLPANFAPQINEPDGMTLMRQACHVDTGLFPVGKYSAEDWRKLRWGYYRLIEKVDAEIGKVLAALHDADLEDNSLVVFTSDHGECAGAQGFNQKTVLYEESARVPLIVSFPGKIKPGTTDAMASTGIDLLPTMLDFAGLKIPKKLPGRSLWPLATGQTVADWRDYVVVEDDMEQAGTIFGFKPQMAGRMVRTQHYKYCVYSRGQKRESLVDLESDPAETKNLAGDPGYRKVLLDHRALLAQFAREHNDPLAAALLTDNVKPIPFPLPASGKPNQP